jgi:hypothetical protein
MAMDLSVKKIYVSSTLTLGAILLLGCAGTYITKETMTVGAIGRSYIKACKTPKEEDAITSLASSKEGSQALESRKWARIVGDTKGNVAATTVPLQYDSYCVEIGNNTPPSGFWGHVFDFLVTAAPFVAMAFGIPAL